MLIALIGMPGSGKSTFGKELALKLQYDFADLDTLITKREKKTIEDIFSLQGEDYFRKAENEALKSILHTPRLIVATGGGTPCFFNNIELLNQYSLSIYLKVSLDTIADRILNDTKNIRPLYEDKNKEALITTLQDTYERRVPFYHQAKLCMEV